MNKHYLVAAMILLIVIGVAGGFFSMIYQASPGVNERTPMVPTSVAVRPVPGIPGPLAFTPANLLSAPPPMSYAIMDGYRILMDEESSGTEQRTRLACRNCHFDAGRSQETISLVGVSAKYPRMQEHGPQYEVESLARKVQVCYVENLNHPAPALESREMQSILAYLGWISRDIPVGVDPPWTGLEPLQGVAGASTSEGRKIFSGVCTRCHGEDGQGTGIAPALWGDHSFTTASLMTRQPMLAAFVRRFMPYRQPTLNDTAAGDVAAFVLSQPRRQPGTPLPPAIPEESQPHLILPAASPMAGMVPPELQPGTDLKQVAQKIEQALKALPEPKNHKSDQPGPTNR